MKVSRFIFNMFGVNTYIVYDPDSREAAIIDPGMTSEDERNAIDSFIERNSLHPVHLIDTHMHLDHIFGNLHVKNKYGLPVEAHSEDEFLSLGLSAQARQFRLPIDVTDHGIDRKLIDGEKIKIGDEALEVICVPGHSPGSVALYAPKSGFVITGDALFRGSIGRTDLARGNHSLLVKSITDRLLSLPPSTIVLPGHGPETTIGAEMTGNPYI